MSRMSPRSEVPKWKKNGDKIKLIATTCVCVWGGILTKNNLIPIPFLLTSELVFTLSLEPATVWMKTSLSLCNPSLVRAKKKKGHSSAEAA